ncbi:MAG: 5-formyltetrahydrofolate cyclo-ligase [Chlamydiia bacterium]|nr:5-formyltetrahydrofolate cyclo-ligase [Chlamydiia bacterium]
MKSEEKKALRLFFKEKRSKISLERRKEAEKHLLDDLYPSLVGYSGVLSFASFGDEINMWLLNETLCKEGRLLLPRIENDSISIYLVSDIKKELVKSTYGILEPDPKTAKKHSELNIHCALVPALGFDEYNHRLGYGKGHFDRFIHKLENTITVGVGFKEQFVGDPLPVEEHDKKLDHVVLF